MKNLKFAAAGIALCASMLLTSCSGGSSVKYTKSTVDEDSGKFTSEFLGIGADFDTEEWMFLNDTLASYNGGKTSEEDLRAILESGSVTNSMIYEMFVGKESGTNINIVIQNSKVAGGFSEEGYIDISLDGIEEELEKDGTMENPKAEKKNISFAGANHYCMDVSGESDGMELHERLICIKVGDYMGIVTITSLSTAERDEITKMFYAV